MVARLASPHWRAKQCGHVWLQLLQSAGHLQTTHSPGRPNKQRCAIEACH